MMNKWIGWTCGTVLLASVAVAQERPALVTVSSIQAEQLIEKIKLDGSVIALQSSDISAEVAGRITSIAVERGDSVKTDDTLLGLRNRPATLRLKVAEAELKKAQAGVQLAKISERRQKKLLGSKAVSQDNYDTALARLDEAMAQADAMSAVVDQLQDELDRHIVSAPINGVVSHRAVEIGMWVETGTVLFTLQNTRIARFQFSVPQQYYGQVFEGAAIDIELDAFPGEVFTAEVSRKIPIASDVARTFDLWVELDNSRQQIVPGMSARATLYMQQAGFEPSLTVPQDALVRKADGSVLLWVVEQSGDEAYVVSIAVQPGYAQNGWVEVSGKGLLPDAKVVVRGNETLRAGQQVQIQSES